MIGVHSVATCEAVFEATRDWVWQWLHNHNNDAGNDDQWSIIVMEIFVVHCDDDGIDGSDGDGVHSWNEDSGDDVVLKLTTSWESGVILVWTA